ncbi:hypothetical protein [Jiella sonneratiae]|uniref:Uncharacterized protein n=1 Tax=Jiella sonneratiae TaxID=2816856 RepID=A0ABS3J2Q5_9HYPH|nr:hypothetical protein [Jiella sonneratiae]MBO0903943.1 hypothetical protein [Jiella sonneratiae]
MTAGEKYVESLPRKRHFHDRNERRSYETARIVAARLIDDPRSLRQGLAYMRRHMEGDPHQADYLRLWQDVIRQDTKEIARLLLEDSPRGALLRDTRPVFHVLTDEERRTAHLAAAGAGDAGISSEGLRP